MNGVRVYRKQRTDAHWDEWTPVGTFYDDDDAYREQSRIIAAATLWTRTQAFMVEDGIETYRLGGELSNR